MDDGDAAYLKEEEEYEQQQQLDPHKLSDIEDQLCQMHDAFFNADYNSVVNTATKILEIKEDEEDVYELLSLSLTKLRRFEEASESASIWCDFFKPNMKSISILLESSYLSDNFDNLKRAADALLTLQASPESASGPVSWFFKYSIQVFLRDLDPSYQILPEFLTYPEALNNDTPEQREYEITRKRLLDNWLIFRASSNIGPLLTIYDELKSNKKESSNYKNNLILAFALVGLATFEREETNLLQEYYHDFTSNTIREVNHNNDKDKGADDILHIDESHIQGIRALMYILEEKEGMDSQIKQLLLAAFASSHMLLRKRINNFLA
jgi:hypothetical protein